MYKIGEIIRLKEDIELRSTLSDSVTKVPKGDKAVVSYNGSLKFLKGGFITPPNTVKFYDNGYAIRDITHLITSKINILISEYLYEDDDILQEVKDEIWNIVEQDLEDIFA